MNLNPNVSVGDIVHEGNHSYDVVSVDRTHANAPRKPRIYVVLKDRDGVVRKVHKSNSLRSFGIFAPLALFAIPHIILAEDLSNMFSPNTVRVYDTIHVRVDLPR